MGEVTVRYFPAGFVFDVSGCSVFVDDDLLREPLAGYLYSLVEKQFLEVLAPTVNCETGHVANFPAPPFTPTLRSEATKVSRWAIDEKLRYYADQRIPLDLDGGVKVNYGKFGDLLAEVKAVTGK